MKTKSSVKTHKTTNRQISPSQLILQEETNNYTSQRVFLSLSIYFEPSSTTIDVSSPATINTTTSKARFFFRASGGSTPPRGYHLTIDSRLLHVRLMISLRCRKILKREKKK